jgi:hypothetical protein
VWLRVACAFKLNPPPPYSPYTPYTISQAALSTKFLDTIKDVVITKANGWIFEFRVEGWTIYGDGTSTNHLYNIQCSKIFTLRNEKLHTEA